MTLPETSTPIIAAVLVGGIGVLGIVAGFVAYLRVIAEDKALESGGGALAASLNSLNLDSTDPITWLATNAVPKNSHFGDHLLSVWHGWLAERVPTLSELHSLSSRRERRRLSARISGGITALLLVCGIAGTLLCIHPILDAFTIRQNEEGEVLIDPLVAQRLIRSLGSAFLPSLTALVFTVLVAIFRGVYVQATTGLAWRLDRFAVEQLFPLFKPKRFGTELTQVHLKLSRLVDQLAERDREFGVGFELFGKAALDLKESGPRLKAASDRITNAADRLACETGTMTKALETCLGEDSALTKGTSSLKEILAACQETAKETRKASCVLATSLAELSGKFELTRTQLEKSIAEIPTNIQQGCDSGNRALVDGTCTLDQATAGLSAAVAGIPSQIKDGCNLGIEALIEGNQKAVQGAADSIAKAAESATSGIKTAAYNAQKDIQTSGANAGEDFMGKAKEASGKAAAAIGEAALAAAKDVKEEVEPIKRAATELREQLVDTRSSIDVAAMSFKTTASEAADQAAKIFGEAATAGANSIKVEVEPITRITSEMGKTLSDAAEVISEGRNPKAAVTRPPRKLWKRVLSLGLLK